MYTEENLKDAVKQNIFNQSSVDSFRDFVANGKNTTLVDEENFKLINSFNDIFVVISSLLFLFSLRWVLNDAQNKIGYFIFPIVAWGLSEIFVRKKKMLLPGIVLLIAFIGGVFVLCLELSPFKGVELELVKNKENLIFASFVTTISAYFHWVRFRVPITVALNVILLYVFLLSIILSAFPTLLKDHATCIFLLFGVMAFALAMFWDCTDIHRTTYKSDVAFWLHLTSAPLIIHPIFSIFDALKNHGEVSNIIIIIILYIFLSLIAIIINRRGFMVSSLIYVIYAVSSVLSVSVENSYGLALTGAWVGGALLLLSIYWHQIRKRLLGLLPKLFRIYLAH